MRTTIVIGCLYCGLRLPEQADFCPECGRPLEVAIRVDSEVNMKRTIIAKGCLYCGLRLPEQADFCPECGRPLERVRIPYVTQESDADCPDAEIEGKDDLVLPHEASSDAGDPFAVEIHRMRDEDAYDNLIHSLMVIARGNG